MCGITPDLSVHVPVKSFTMVLSDVADWLLLLIVKKLAVVIRSKAKARERSLCDWTISRHIYVTSCSGRRLATSLVDYKILS